MSYSLWTSAVAAGVTAMWIGAAAPAEAGTVVVPFSVTFIATGTVKMGVDPADLFGGGDLSGLPYVATYTFQTTPSTTPPYYCCAGKFYRPGRNEFGIEPRYCDLSSNDHHQRRYFHAFG